MKQKRIQSLKTILKLKPVQRKCVVFTNSLFHSLQQFILVIFDPRAPNQLYETEI